MAAGSYPLGNDLLAEIKGLSTFPGTPVANLALGAQLGAGLNAAHIDAHTPAVFNAALCVVLSTPAMYQNFPEIGNLIKTLIECHAKSVTGLDFAYSLDTQDTIIGHDGQVMDVPTQGKRSQPSPTFVWQEVQGNLVWNTMRKWIMDTRHPDSNASFMHTGEADSPPFMSSSYAMTMLAIQCDPTMRDDRILDAALYTNMFPTTTGDLGMERQIGQSQIRERSITFKAHVQHDDYVRAISAEIYKAMRIRKINYNAKTPTQKQVNQAIAAAGLKNEVDKMSADYKIG